METGTKQQKAPNDLTVLEAYGFPKVANESEIVARRFKMYHTA